MKKEHLQLFKRMDTLMRLKATGDCYEFAQILGVSKNTIYRLIEEIKIDFDAPIIYNRH